MSSGAVWRNVCLRPMLGALALGQRLRRSVFAAIDHEALTLAQACAYSAMVALFPALIVAAAAIGLLPDTTPLRFQMAMFFDRILPSNVSPLLGGYFALTHRTPQTARAIASSLVVSIAGASSVMAVLMEGFRRAHDLPLPQGSFWSRRKRALELVPLSLVPMAGASLLVVFGHLISGWLAGAMSPALQGPVYVLAFLLRWIVALGGSVGIIAVIYHLGTNPSIHMRAELEPMLREPWILLRKEWSWRESLPGAMVATLAWFISTLIFGLYVTRFANYSRVYGSLGAGIALLLWLYIVALCVLVGAEFNAQRAAERRDPKAAALLWKLPEATGQTAGRMTD